MMKRVLLGTLGSLAMVLLLGCAAHTKISDINKDPGRFAGREVTVSGHTSQSFGALSNGAFQVDDGSGTIWVVSQNFGVPGNGSKVTVTGTVQQGFNFGARSFGTVIRQTKNRK